MAGMPDLPHETASGISQWRQEWGQVLAERDRLSCLQSGQRGPPFAQELLTAGWLERWLPWNWYSLDGTGWCFDTDWDELVHCTQMDSDVDWNGVSASRNDVPALPAAHTLAFLCCAAVLLLAFAYREWAVHESYIRSGGYAPSPLFG